MSSQDTAETWCAKTTQEPSDESLEARVAALENQVQDLCGIVDQQAETINAQNETIRDNQAQLETQNEIIDTQQAQIDELEAKLETETERRKSVESELEELTDDCDWLNDILFDLEDDLFGEYQSTLALSELDADSIAEHLIETQSSDTESGDDANDDGNSILQNSLTKVLQWPREVVERELTKNEALARKVAQRIPELAKKTGKGYVITSRMIGDFFVSDRGQRPHTQTVARIIDFLVRFAGEHVEVSKKRGRKRLAFDEELVAALDHTRGDGGNPRGA